MQLAELQAELQRHLLGAPSTIADELAPSGGIGTTQRLAIYHTAYRMRLVDALRDSFGHTLAYLGDDWFQRDALHYVEAHPSTHPSLRWYGAGFASWLARTHPGDPDIAEMASLDWALRRAFDGPDATPLTVADLAGIAPSDWAALRLTFVPTAERLVLRHNTLAIWHALDQDQVPPPAQPLPDELAVLVWRRELSPHFRSLGAVEAAAVDAVRAGAGFGALCMRLAESFPERDASVEAGALLRRWIDEGLLGGWASGA